MDHKHAWIDLHQRILKGEQELTDLIASTGHDTKEAAEREYALMCKREGVRDGLTMWESIEEHVRWGNPSLDLLYNDHARAWTALTGGLLKRARTETDPNIRAGIVLVNRWQTGYGPNIDADQIVPA